jgi:hypothetical protein
LLDDAEALVTQAPGEAAVPSVEPSSTMIHRKSSIVCRWTLATVGPRRSRPLCIEMTIPITVRHHCR